MKSKILILTLFTLSFAQVFLSCKATSLSKHRVQNISLPTDKVLFSPVFCNNNDSICYYEEVKSQITDAEKYKIKYQIYGLDRLGVLNHRLDTVFVLGYYPLLVYSTSTYNHFPLYIKVGNKDVVYKKQTFEISHSRCELPNKGDLSFRLNPWGYGQTFDIIKLNPDAIFLSLIYKWDIKAITEFLKYAAPWAYSISAHRYIISKDSVTEIQSLYIPSAPANWYNADIEDY